MNCETGFLAKCYVFNEIFVTVDINMNVDTYLFTLVVKFLLFEFVSARHAYFEGSVTNSS